jgi:ribosome-associated translation inhibitor RaiA
MRQPVRITFRRLQPSEEVVSTINRHVSKIERICARGQIIACHVVVELPHRNKRKGGQYRVRASVTLPGVDAVASRAPSAAARNSVLQIAIAEAMAAVKRKVVAHARKRDGQRRIREHMLRSVSS